VALHAPFDVAVGQAVPQVPPDGDRDNFSGGNRKPAKTEVVLRAVTRPVSPAIRDRPTQQCPPEFIEAARLSRHAPGDRWFVDETYVKVLASGLIFTVQSIRMARSSTSCTAAHYEITTGTPDRHRLLAFDDLASPSEPARHPDPALACAEMTQRNSALS